MLTQSRYANLLATPTPAGLGPGPRPGVRSEESLQEELRGLFQSDKLPVRTQDLVRALILLWHDHLEAAHGIVQNIETADGAFIHGIMHRREPDYSNAAYWFRRVGQHAAFPELAQRIGELLEPADRDLRQKLVAGGQWNPFRFIDACQQAATGSISEGEQRRLTEVQRIEFEVLLDWLVSAQ